MFVTRSYHRRVVHSLLAVMLLFTVLFFIVLYRIGFLGSFAPHVSSTDLALLERDAPKTPFPKEEEAVVIEATSTGTEVVLPIKKVLFEYVEVVGSCGPHYEGECVRVRSGPGTDYPVVARYRNSMVLKIAGKVEREGHVWYKVVFDEFLHYPERVQGDSYIAAEYANVLLDEGLRTLDDQKNIATSSIKRIIVNRTTQMLYAYEGDMLFMQEKISTGLELTPTPAGIFTIFRKTPSRYMQGPIPDVSDQYYDLPGVPWNLYFTHGGAVIHGAYWHTSFGQKYSHGCVNLPPDKARLLYYWADLGTRVTVKD
jgi:hypothetical protein